MKLGNRHYHWLERLGLIQTMYIISHSRLIASDEQHVMLTNNGYFAMLEESGEEIDHDYK